jgi:hypothetical protein
MVQAGLALKRLGKVVCRVELMEMMLLAGSTLLPIWKFACGVSPTNCEEGVIEQEMVRAVIVTSPVFANAVPDTAALSGKLEA